MKRTKITGMLVLAFAAVSVNAWAHCEIPCGIYDDELKMNELRQHVDTIEKAVTEIKKLEAADKKDMNQLVRWIQNKDEHADKIKSETAEYFLSQRVKFPQDEAGRDLYTMQLTKLHEVTVYAMKSKQTVDAEIVRQLRASLEAFADIYFHKHE